ncbi:hypothetical protein HKBW3S34_02559, partial [Candidatus Hakubella thermalkaliphila]
PNIIPLPGIFLKSIKEKKVTKMGSG